MKRTLTIAAALVASMMASPVMAQNCQTYYHPWERMPVNDYDCYQRFVWYNQGKGSWCARDWYRSCMHAGWHEANASNNADHDWQYEDGRLIRDVDATGWVTGYSEHDDGRVAPRNIYVSGGKIIVHPYVCRGSLKKTPDDPGQRIESNDALAMEYFPNPTLSEIRRYITSGACVGCAGRGNLMGTGC